MNLPLFIKVEQPFFDRVERQRRDNCETARSSPGARHNLSPTLQSKVENFSTLNICYSYNVE